MFFEVVSSIFDWVSLIFYIVFFSIVVCFRSFQFFDMVLLIFDVVFSFFDVVFFIVDVFYSQFSLWFFNLWCGCLNCHGFLIVDLFK